MGRQRSWLLALLLAVWHSTLAAFLSNNGVTITIYGDDYDSDGDGDGDGDSDSNGNGDGDGDGIFDGFGAPAQDSELVAAELARGAAEAEVVPKPTVVSIREDAEGAVFSL